MTDARKELSERIADAFARGTPLEIRGGGGKRFYGNPPSGEVLETKALCGVESYEPSELYFCAGAGTLLTEAEAALAERNQALAFEPPHFEGGGVGATLGGALAAGLSGPRRPFAGAARDFVLGVEIADGRGELLRFGGRVIKNVAGFDLSRLCAGAMGTLGALTEVTFRVSPRAEAELTTVSDCGAAEGIRRANALLNRGLPLTATAWHRGVLHLRWSGAAGSALRAAKEAGGDVLSEEAGGDFWGLVRDHRHSFFGGGENLWRIGCAPLSPVWGSEDSEGGEGVEGGEGGVGVEGGVGSQLIEWRGALRWLRGSRAAAEKVARHCGGHLTLFRAADAGEGNRFPELSAPVANLHRELKRVFDPSDILNRGRMYDFSAG